ncbi:MAG: DUF58 domain-containing protein [Planctomycetota bacterium]|nr:DUF58 domain-containing protein [Planctomycetota bacterium]
MARSAKSPALSLAPELIARVRQVELYTHRLVSTALAGGWRSTFRGQGVEFEEVRPYQPGDDVRSIDWNVTARTGEPFVKAFREERELCLQLVVDTSLSMDFGTGQYSKRQAAAQLSALFATVCVRSQDRVGLTLFGPDGLHHLKAGKSSTHVQRLIRDVFAAPVTPPGTPMSSILEGLERAVNRRSMILFCSDFAGLEDRDPDVVDRLARLSARHDVIALFVHDPFERSLPEVGILEMEDPLRRRRLSVDGRSEEVREAWSSAFEQRRQVVRSVFARTGVDCVEVDTGADLVDPVLEFFRRRRMERGGRTR